MLRASAGVFNNLGGNQSATVHASTGRVASRTMLVVPLVVHALQGRFDSKSWR